MSAWPQTKLGELIVEAAYGTSVKCSESAEGVPVLRMGNVRYDGTLDLRDLKYASLTDAEREKFGIKEGDILFNRTNSKDLVGKTGLWDGRFPAAVASYFIRVRVARDIVCPEWVWHFMNSAVMKNRLFATARGAIGQANINSKELKSFLLPVPPLEEQRRIVGLLGRAAEIRRQADAAHAKARAILPALFLDMFGNPATNPKRWAVTTIADAGEVKLGRQRAPRYQTGRFTRPYVRVANVFENRIDVSNLLSMDFDERDFAAYRLEYGDILLNEGQSIELVGRPALWREEVPDCCFQNTLVRFRCDPKRMVSEFALAVFLWMYHSGQFMQIASKTSNVAHLGASRFAKLPMVLPPLPLQTAFAEQAQRVEVTARALDAAAAKAEAMAAALSAEVFG